jgi:histone-lysine N-methyltransferase SETMAR
MHTCKTAVCTWVPLEHFSWKLFGHPPYSPDLALSNYHLFIYLKNWLGPQCFSNNEELMEGVKTWLSSQAINFFDTGIQNLIPRYKCIGSNSDYVENYLKYVRIFCL